MVLIILRFSGEGPDKEHPWGHAHFETLGTAILGSVLIAVAGAMIYDSALSLSHTASLPIPEWPTLVVAAVSVAGKEWIFRYTLKVAKETKSDLLVANAWHSRTDSLSSIVVFVGILGTMAGLTWLDAVAAILVAFIVGKIGWDLSWSSIKQLVGTALPYEQISRYKELVLSIDGIINVHSFKSREMGSQSILELHIQVLPNISASEGHLLGDLACEKLKQEDPDIGHIIYHIDTYNDEEIDQEATHQLPLRKEITAVIQSVLRLQKPEITPHKVALYYHPKSVDLEILLYKEDMLFIDTLGCGQEVLAEDIRKALIQSGIDGEHIGYVFLAAGTLK
jgi:cation diffusion facilitator family transporter